jgi:hypothetical protein
MGWARRLKRVFGIEIELCARCGGRIRVIASIEKLEHIARILAHRLALHSASTKRPFIRTIRKEQWRSRRRSIHRIRLRLPRGGPVNIIASDFVDLDRYAIDQPGPAREVAHGRAPVPVRSREVVRG